MENRCEKSEWSIEGINELINDLSKLSINIEIEESATWLLKQIL